MPVMGLSLVELEGSWRVGAELEADLQRVGPDGGDQDRRRSAAPASGPCCAELPASSSAGRRELSARRMCAWPKQVGRRCGRWTRCMIAGAGHQQRSRRRPARRALFTSWLLGTWPLLARFLAPSCLSHFLCVRPRCRPPSLTSPRRGARRSPSCMCQRVPAPSWPPLPANSPMTTCLKKTSDSAERDRARRAIWIGKPTTRR